MSIFDRMSRGWEISKLCFGVLKANKSLVIFPILSGTSSLVILGSFCLAVFAAFGWNIDRVAESNRLLDYGLVFICYLVNYFVIVFFNMALIHCARLHFEGEAVTVSKGIRFSMSRIGVIFSWALFAATIGLPLKAVQENLGTVGKIIIGLIGIVWSIATFFTVPILAYEDVNPAQALKRSARMMREKWGESLGASFSFGLVQFVCFLFLALVAVGVGYVNTIAGVAIGLLGIVLLAAVFSALHSIFVSAVYHHVAGNAYTPFRDDMFDTLFVTKDK